MELEKLQDRVSESLIHLQFNQLKDVCIKGKIAAENDIMNGNNRRALMRIINTALDDTVEQEEQDCAQQYLLDLLAFISEIKQQDGSCQGNTGDNTETEIAQLKELKRQYSEMQKSFQASTQAMEDEIKYLSEKLKINEQSTAESLSRLTQPNKGRVPEVTIRRDFKISGQIGERGQKDKLSYTNLMHQVDTGLQKGHTEVEIIEAVVKAISPGLNLRDMLEIKSDLTLSQLKIILKGHFKEEGSADLYHRLVSISQDSRESPQNFLFRAIELKERLLFASKEVGADEQYSAELIQRKFLRSVNTGLLSDHIKFQLKPYLDDQAVADEVLIEKLNEAASFEWERQQKQKKNLCSKITKVNELHTEMQIHQQSGNRTENSKSLQQVAQVNSPSSGTPRPEKSRKAVEMDKRMDPDLYDIVKQLKEDMAKMKEMVSLSVKHSHRPNPQKRGCRACQDTGEGEMCNHCFKCGQQGHLSRGCRAQKQQGNEGRLPSRDRQ